ncbi:hypothetical protein K458DRAFT_33047 [Lentithecium fluviatile CBS 122367]|uniref:Uncharacterized protein n=1 Tax=Lentithecium fluviatile CBS 122367 TaxID=1168545 RepID=A0A6G1J1X9_9PLEO|nr:hypothetical protein K458DRAFT_33047 [Lentithecium fluviatile CBS 122367]
MSLSSISSPSSISPPSSQESPSPNGSLSLDTEGPTNDSLALKGLSLSMLICMDEDDEKRKHFDPYGLATKPYAPTIELGAANGSAADASMSRSELRRPFETTPSIFTLPIKTRALNGSGRRASSTADEVGSPSGSTPNTPSKKNGAQTPNGSTTITNMTAGATEDSDGSVTNASRGGSPQRIRYDHEGGRNVTPVTNRPATKSATALRRQPTRAVKEKKM